MLKDLGILTLRAVTGGLLIGHGGQKLFGWFGGPGMEGTTGMMQSLGLEPGSQWAKIAGGSEVGGGLLTALGLLHPIGPIIMHGPMLAATRQVHWDKPIWVTEGGAELPLTNMAVGVALATNEPGRFSLDSLLGIRIPGWVSLLALGGVVAGVIMMEAQTRQQGQPEEPQQEAAA